MYDFILQLFLVSSLAVVVYLMARALPRVSEEEADSNINIFNYFERWFQKLPIAKADNYLSNSIEKTLRKTRVVVLKVDNAINKQLSKKNKGQEDGESISFIDKIKKDNE